MFNLVVLTGRLTADPELKTTPNGIPVTTFSIAVNRNYRAGEEQQTDFINIVAWRQQAEFLSRFFAKGRMVGVVGSIQTRNYERDGQRVYVTEVVADEISFVDSKSQGDSAPQSAPAPSANTNSFGADDGFIPMPADDDLPF